MATQKPTLLVAREGFVGGLDGKDIYIEKGDLVEADHPIVKKWPELFEAPLLRFPVRGIEQATAAPGEKRKR